MMICKHSTTFKADSTSDSASECFSLAWGKMSTACVTQRLPAACGDVHNYDMPSIGHMGFTLTKASEPLAGLLMKLCSGL